MKVVKFGVIADLHHALIHNGLQRLTQFLDAAEKEDVDFIVELGDFHILAYDDQTESGKHRRFTPAQVHRKFEPLRRFNSFKKPAYHVLGNHDCDYYDYQTTLQLYEMEHNYYAFHVNGWHFIALDGNYMRDEEGNYLHYSKGQYFKKKGTLPYINPEQLEWLEKELAQGDEPVVIFSHQPLFDYHACILNLKDFQDVITRAKAKGRDIKLCVNGHLHVDDLDCVDGTLYYNANAVSSGDWVGKAYAAQRYSDKTEKDNPYLQYIIPYKKALYTFITLDDEGFHVTPRKGGLVSPTTEELGYVRSNTRTESNGCILGRDVKWPE